MRKYLLLLFALSLVLAAGSAFAVNFIVNPGFEDGTGNAAPPWSLWEGTGGAVANPLVDVTNPSARCWFNTGGSRNLAAANSVNLILDTTGAVTYHVKVMYYVPALLPGMDHAGPMVRFHCLGPIVDGGIGGVAGDPILLDDSVPANAVAVGSWVVKEFDWVNTSGCNYLLYPTFRMYGEDATTPASGRTAVAPDVYIDNCELSSTDYYTPTFSGTIKDSATSLGIPGASVTIKGSTGAPIVTTTANGSGVYSVVCPVQVPLDMAWTADATADLYASDGAQAFTITGASPAIPDVTMTRAATTVHISGTVTGPGGPIVGATVRFVSSSVSVSTTTLSGGAYSKEVAPDSYTVSCSQFPLTAPSQIAYTFDPTGEFPMDVVGLDFTLASSLLVDVNAADLSAGPVTEWANNGTLGGKFISPAASGQWPGEAPAVTLVGGKKAALLAGKTAMALVDSGGVAINSPEAIVGVGGDVPINPVFTLAAWVYRETPGAGWSDCGLFSWGPFVYGANFQYATGDGSWAADHWYSGNLGWSTVPPVGAWHQLVYTSDGTNETVYSDGVVAGTATAPIAFLNINPDTKVAETGWNGAQNPLVLGAITDSDAYNFWAGRAFMGAIAGVRIYSVPMTASDVADLLADYTLPEPLVHTINAGGATGGDISPSGDVDVLDGDSQTFTIGATLGYAVSKVLVDTVEQLPIPTSYTFTNVTTDHAIFVETILLSTASVSGKVTDKDGVGIDGASVYFSGTPSASVAPFVTATTEPDGTYIQTGVPQGTVYVSAGGVAGKWNSPDKVVVVDADKTGVDFTLLSNTRNIPAEGDLLLEMLTESLPSSGPWPCAVPAATSLTVAAGTPGLETVGNVPWEKNASATFDCWRLGRYATPIVCDGASIVVVAKPTRGLYGEPWDSIVDIFYDRLCMGIKNDNGFVCVKRNINTINTTDTSAVAIPEGQATILSLVVQPDGSYKVWANGVEIMNMAGTGAAFTSLNPGGCTGDPINGYDTYINVGRNNPDGWPTFNGNIGDVFVYTKALSISELNQLNADLGVKFGITVAEVLVPHLVSGVVKDSIGNPVPAANMEVFKKIGGVYSYSTAGVSLGDGSYSFSVNPGDYRIFAAMGNTLGSVDVTVVGSDVPNKDITLVGQSSAALIDIKAAGLASGNLSVWPNLGTAGGQFNSNQSAAPVVGTVAGYKAVSFNGTAGMISSILTPLVLTGKSSLTESAWVYQPAAPGGEDTIVCIAPMWSGSGAYTLWLNYGSDTGWGLADFGDFGMGCDPIPAVGAWHHIAISYDNSIDTATVYVDNTVAATNATLDANIVMGGNVTVGYGYGNGGGNVSPFGGSIASVEIYPVAMNATAIGVLFNNPPWGPARRLVGVNNRSVLTDNKLIGPLYEVKCWGNIVSIGTGSYVISDGYTAGVTINGTPEAGKGVGNMVVVTGVVQADHSVTP